MGWKATIHGCCCVRAYCPSPGHPQFQAVGQMHSCPQLPNRSGYDLTKTPVQFSLYATPHWYLLPAELAMFQMFCDTFKEGGSAVMTAFQRITALPSRCFSRRFRYRTRRACLDFTVSAVRAGFHEAFTALPRDDRRAWRVSRLYRTTLLPCAP